MRLFLGAAAGALALSAGVAGAQERAPITIGPQPLESALYDFGGQTGLQVLFAPGLATAKRTAGVSSETDVDLAMTRLLAGTGLVYRRDGDMLVIVQAGEGGGPQGASAGDVDALIVTAQKKEENIQDVPIAISAFSQRALDEQKIEGGYDLLKAVPNVTFSKSNYSSYNFSIRGVGTKAVSATSDPGVAVSFNNVSLLRNRLYEQEYFDVERVEVLRGPQGTLYGRNATGGVVNMITAKPRFDEVDGQVKAEVGNYDARRMSAMVNVPLVQGKLAVRIAGAATERDGYGFNLTTGEDTDNRDLWSARVTLGFNPVESLRANLIWERFEEDDQRLRTGKQLCHRDPGLESIINAQVLNLNGTPDRLITVENLDRFARGRLSQGCKMGSLYEAGAYGRPNGFAIPFLPIMMTDIGYSGYDKPASDPTRKAVPLVSRDRDPYGDGMQSRDLRAIESIIAPEYRAKADILALNIDFDITDTLTLSSQTAYNEDSVYSLQDYMRFSTQPIFPDTTVLYGADGETLNDPGVRGHMPAGVFTDPQIGPSDSLKGFEVSSSESKQFSQEFRIQSDFEGSVNFSAGLNYLRFKGVNDYFLFLNIVTLLAQYYHNADGYSPDMPGAIYVDDSPFDQLVGDGHNYFRNQNPYRLESKAAFGELYWQASDTLKLTAGLRYTDDRKIFTLWPSHLMVLNSANSRYGPRGDIKQKWQEVTGRLGVDWTPELGFTDDTMVYAFYSRGYKGGGANPPPAKSPYEFLQVTTPRTFEPEFVDAFEVGTKNSLLDGALMLNGAAFYYDYKDYQVSKVVDRTIVNEGFDAEMWGAELEALWRPTRNLRLNANVGYLKTRIGDGERSLDIFNRTQGNPDWIVMIPFAQQSSNCIMPKAYVAEQIELARLFNLGPGYNGDALNFLTYGGCLAYVTDFDPMAAKLQALYGEESNQGQGFLADVSGNELPNSPRWTLSLGGDYTWELDNGWEVNLRGDYYRQADSWSRVYAEVSDRLRGWDNVNLSLTVSRPEDDVTVQLYAKNVFDKTPITDAFLNSDSTGMTTNVFVLDPRLIGFSISKGF